MSIDKNYARALRYRRLALAEVDKWKASLLNQIADEAERGVLCTVDERIAIATTSASSTLVSIKS